MGASDNYDIPSHIDYYIKNDAAGLKRLGPRRRMNRSLIFSGSANFSIRKPNVWWNIKMQGVRTQVPANPGMADWTAVVSMDACYYKGNTYFWLVMSIGDNVHERPRLAWAWFRCIFVGISMPREYSVGPSTLSLYIQLTDFWSFHFTSSVSWW